MIIRHENFGNLIWSDSDKGYFIPINEEIDKKVNKILKEQNKDIEILEELEKMGWKNGVKKIESNNKSGLSAPLEYYYDYTNACNLKCAHCYNREYLNCDTMSEEEIEYIIKDMYESGVMRLHLAGGEPTLFPNKLEKYMATAKKYGIVTSMSSNGILVSEEIGNIITNNNVTSFTISIESANEEKNAKIRGSGTLNKAIEGINKIVKFKERNNGTFNIAIKMSYDIDTSKEEFEKMIELAIELKIDVLKLINPERCEFHERGYYSSIAKKYYAVQEIIRELQEKYKDELNITIVNSPVNLHCVTGLPNAKGCIGGQELVAINPDGNVTPCLMNKYYLGNIFKDKSIKNIYMDDKINKYREQISDYDCKECKYHSQCRGGCQVRKVVEYGRITSVDPLCPIKNQQETKEMREEKQKYKYFKKIVNMK